MRALSFLLALICTSALALPEGDFSIDSSKSEIQYQVIHKFHTVIGKTRKIEGRTLVAPPSADLMIRIDAASFDSGDGNRDAHQKEVIAAHKFPYIEFRAKLADGEKGQIHADGKLLFHGIEKPLTTIVKLTPIDGDWRADLEFSFKLSDFNVERPSLLFVKIEDNVDIRGTLWFKKKGAL